MTNEQIFSSVILKILIDVEERNMKMKRFVAVLLALTVFVGLLPAMDLSVKAADAYVLSGIPENVDVTVDGVVVTTAGGSVSVAGGAVVGVSPAKGYEIKELEVQELEPIGDMVFVTLDADDVWEDGSGYQMLLDSDANTFGSVIPETGGLTTSGDASADVYAEFEYKIPENADGALDTSNVLIGASQTIEVEPGTYDWCITNPTPGDRVWIASANGSVPGRYDDFVFELGHVYDFHVYLNSPNDAVDLVDSEGFPGDYISVTDNGDGSYSFVMPSSDAQMKVTVKEIKTGLFYDFETEDQYNDWFTFDADGDEDSWALYSGATGFAPSGDIVFGSASYKSTTGDLYPDNWLFLDSKEIPEEAELSFWLANASTSWPDSVEVYIGTEDQLDPSGTSDSLQTRFFKVEAKKVDSVVKKSDSAVTRNSGLRGLQDHMTPIGETSYTPGTSFEEYVIDLSAYAGETMYIAWRHNTAAMYAIYLDDVWLHGKEEEPAALEPTADDLADGTIQLVWDEIENAASYDVFSLDGGNQTLLGTAGPETVYVDTRDHKMGETYSFLVVAKYDNGDSICDGSVDDMFNPFADVADDSPSFEYIAWAYNNEIVKGSLKDDGFRYFEPDGSTTRMNFVMILYKMHGSPKVSGKNPFKDVTGSKSVKAVLWAYNKGLVKGTDKTHFSPDVNLSRMNIIMILYKLAGSPKVSGDNPFEDISGSKTIKAVLWAVKKKIITGVDDTHFDPDGDCSRELFVEVLYKYNKIYKILK